ncbi:MAG TPA: RNA methyltransferase [Geminicoccaceae bacterium]|jgi:tRNA/rRNA methyltransferase|nr:RNA methyltransferase [Geminicoccaceae bacterium]HZA67526.1 RNA methyltransferase [Geminicoccaceae bacterium]
MAEPAEPREPLAPVIVLVRPQLGENVGTAARAMLNFGLSELRLVRPKCGWPNLKALQAASGATEVLNRLQLFDRVEDAASDLHRLYATTARPRDLPKPVLTAAAAAREARAALEGGERVGILFGPERTGLSNDELIYADAVISIPVNPAFFSLNLAQAVLLIGYEWIQSASRIPARREVTPAGRPANKGELDQLLEHLIAELDAVDFFRTADRRRSMSRALKLIFARADLHEPDVHLLRGVIKELARGGRPHSRD